MKVHVVALLSPDGRIVESVAFLSSDPGSDERTNILSYIPDVPKGWRVALIQPEVFESARFTAEHGEKLGRILNRVARES